MNAGRWLVVSVVLGVSAGCGPGGDDSGPGSTSSSSSSGGPSSAGSSSSARTSSSAGAGTSGTGDAPWDPCAPGRVINLSWAGTRHGATTTYRGSNTGIPSGTGWPAACVPADAPRHVQVFSYVLTAPGRLVLSTFHADTALQLDTVLWAQDACTPEALPWGCNDDVPVQAVERTPPPPEGAQRQSLLVTSGPGQEGATALLAQGTKVFIFLAGYRSQEEGWQEAGDYVLTVTQVDSPSRLDGPCAPDAEPALCPDTAVCRAAGTDYSAFTCQAAGGRGQPCRDQGEPCGADLGCSLRTVCVDVAAVNHVCDPAGVDNLCVPESSCLAGEDGARCRADGTAGGLCRLDSPECDADLVCSGQVCTAGTPLGGECDPDAYPSPCAGAAHCVEPADGGSARCTADGAPGAVCRDVDPACDPGLACVSARCVSATAVGGACDPQGWEDRCTAGSHCQASGADRGVGSCVADGTAGGRCAAGSRPCGDGLACLKTGVTPGGTCVAARAPGAACDPHFQQDACAPGQVCVAEPDGGAACRAQGYSVAPSTAAWVEACAQGSAVHLLEGLDDDPAPFVLPFAVTFFGVAHPAGTTGTVSPDGWLSFRPGQDPAPAAQPLPALAPDDAIFVLWMDLTFGTPEPGNVTAEACVATVGTAPQRTLVVQWNQAGFYQAQQPGDGATMEVQLHEDSAALDVLYAALTGTEPRDVATVGLQSAGGTAWVQRCAGWDGGCSAGTLVNTVYVPE